ncbi:MAG TPA: mannosyltransferase family protein [Acetobacteraceae bacterium]|nr:mannosyltransferase family protein [Acetobacteraceae bacterium]
MNNRIDAPIVLEERPSRAGRPILDLILGSGWRFPLAMSIVMLGLMGLGMALGVSFIPYGPWHHAGSFASRLLSWDGNWYFEIASNGYAWNPAVGMQLGHYQNVDFYPLYPLIERVVMVITGNGSPEMMVALCLALGVASVFAFHRLARRVLPADAAKCATAIYAFWPATIYFAMGYPTGLINLCALAALSAYVERRYWRAALWCGIGTGVAPTLVFVAIGLCLDQGIAWLRGTRDVREVPRLIGFGLLTVIGLIGFIIFQGIALHDPLAFIKAQEAWGTSPPFLVRLHRFFSPGWYATLPGGGLRTFAKDFHAWRAGAPFTPLMWKNLEFGEQFVLNGITLILGIIGLIAAWRRVRPPALPLAALVVMLGYLWFIVTTNQNLQATPRLIFPAAALFLGLGAFRGRWIYGLLLGLLAILSVINAAFLPTGYWLV